MSDKVALFYKCDLRANTPRDLKWTGVNCVSEDEPRGYGEHGAALPRRPRGILTDMRHAYYLAGQECLQNP
jgi:hypothetical protein